MPHCARLDRMIAESDCHAQVLGAVSGAVLRVCRTACSYGLLLMSTVMPDHAAKAAPVKALPPSERAAKNANGSVHDFARPTSDPKIEQADPKIEQTDPKIEQAGTKAAEANPPARTAPAPAMSNTDFLRPLLAYVLPRYPDAERQGLAFLALLATQYGFSGRTEDLLHACQAAGLTIATRPRPSLIIDDRARQLAGLESPHAS